MTLYNTTMGFITQKLQLSALFAPNQSKTPATLQDSLPWSAYSSLLIFIHAYSSVILPHHCDSVCDSRSRHPGFRPWWSISFVSLPRWIQSPQKLQTSLVFYAYILEIESLQLSASASWRQHGSLFHTFMIMNKEGQRRDIRGKGMGKQSGMMDIEVCRRKGHLEKPTASVGPGKWAEMAGLDQHETIPNQPAVCRLYRILQRPLPW